MSVGCAVLKGAWAPRTLPLLSSAPIAHRLLHADRNARRSSARGGLDRSRPSSIARTRAWPSPARCAGWALDEALDNARQVTIEVPTRADRRCRPARLPAPPSAHRSAPRSASGEYSEYPQSPSPCQYLEYLESFSALACWPCRPGWADDATRIAVVTHTLGAGGALPRHAVVASPRWASAWRRVPVPLAPLHRPHPDQYGQCSADQGPVRAAILRS
jgi:hypothetical protein